MAISFKDSVECYEVAPVIFDAIVIAHGVYRGMGKDDLTVTSLRDGEHMVGSLHYQGLAVDVRIWDFTTDELPELCTQLRAALGPNYDVVLHRSHIHIEYDPD